MGRSFHSPDGKGVYLSAVLRPNCVPGQLMHLTCAVAVAMCDAVENACGVRPQIKWTNDLVIGRKKLGGILTEISVNAKSGLVDYAIIGIGINCLQIAEDFPDDIRGIATSLLLATGIKVPPALLAAKMVQSLEEMYGNLLSKKANIIDRYRDNCMTIGQEISIVRTNDVQHANALDVGADGQLIVKNASGEIIEVSSGEVSVRGMYGYV